MSGNMSRAGATGLRPPRAALPLAAAGMLLLLQPLQPSFAEPVRGTGSATAAFHVTLVVPPAFRVLQVTPVPGGHEYRVWTNMKSVRIRGREYRFDKVGETTFLVTGTDADGLAGLAPDRTGLIRTVAAGSPSATPVGDGSNAFRVTVSY